MACNVYKCAFIKNREFYFYKMCFYEKSPQGFLVKSTTVTAKNFMTQNSSRKLQKIPTFEKLDNKHIADSLLIFYYRKI